MPRTIWEWLEIEETTDRSLIRKAYARQAKKYHPEESPEEAQQLREAYKRALAMAERKAKSADSVGNASADANDGSPKISRERADGVCQQSAGQEQGGSAYRFDYQEGRKEAGEEPGDSAYRFGHQEGRKEAGEEPGGSAYRFDHREDRKEAEQEPGGSAYRFDYQEDRKEAGQEPGGSAYRFDHREDRKEAGQEPGGSAYRFDHREDRKEAEQKSEPARSYQYGHYEEWREADQQEMGQKAASKPAKSYEYNIHQFDAERAERVRSLGKRFIDIYGSPAYRYSGRYWSEAVRDCLTKEDLQEPFVIVTLLSFLVRMPGLPPKVWRALQRELLRYSRKDAEWMQLKERFAEVRRCNNIQNRARKDEQADQAESVGIGGQTSSGKAKNRIFRVIIVAIVSIMMYMGNKFQEEPERERRMREVVNSMSEEFLTVQRPDSNSYLQDHVGNIVEGQTENASASGFQDMEAFQEYYKSSYAYYSVDLNGDKYDDVIRYDQEKDGFVVEYYDPVTQAYVTQGTVDQYLEEHPDKEEFENVACFRSMQE